jgi:hypothetical protein
MANHAAYGEKGGRKKTAAKRFRVNVPRIRARALCESQYAGLEFFFWILSFGSSQKKGSVLGAKRRRSRKSPLIIVLKNKKK